MAREVRRNWFKMVKRQFVSIVRRFIGKPIVYVEVGVWTGNSAEWVRDNVLTHRDSFGIGIDPYLAGHNYNQKYADKTYAEAVVRLCTFRDNGDPAFRLYRQTSQKYLRDGFVPPIDLLYLDGAHEAHNVLMDFVLAWPNLRRGSRVIFDDYGIGIRKESAEGIKHVPTAVRAIMDCYSPFVKEISRGRLFALEVVSHPPLGAIIK